MELLGIDSTSQIFLSFLTFIWLRKNIGCRSLSSRLGALACTWTIAIHVDEGTAVNCWIPSETLVANVSFKLLTSL